MTFVIAALIVFLTFIAGALLAWAFKGFDKAVVKTKVNIENEDKAYNPAITLGFQINSQLSPQEQVKEARQVAARMAAALPRGANSQIGWKEQPGAASASTGLKNDPITATKIAEFHGWDGARTGIPAGGIPQVVVAPVAAPVVSGSIDLVPGKDYPVIEITEDMSPEEMRKARIANSKAKSAAMKKAKSAGLPAAPTAAVAAPAAAAAAPSPAALGIEPPKLIAITEDMSPDDVRKARIANSKAKSSFNKSLKAAGIDPNSVELDDQGNIIMPAGVVAGAPASVPAAGLPAAPAAASPVALGIEPPKLIEITDDMSADEIRNARIANSKAKSAFNKALKAAGIDPKSVELDDKGNITMPAAMTALAPEVNQAATVPTAAAPTPSEGGKIDLDSLGISSPEIIEITDDMSADDIRQARINNSKAKSAFNKALKAAGIDPKSVNL